MAFIDLFIEPVLNSFLKNFGVWLVLTVILGGGAAFMAGRSLAKGWSPIWTVLLYMIPFTMGLRFLHFALFEAKLTSLSHFVTHGLVVTGLAVLGFGITRAQQMSTQYPWLYERTGPWSWRSKA